MQDWTAGYITDIPYTCGYYHEMNPLWLRLVFASCGAVFPDAGAACELGYGQGLSTTIHASATQWQWHGTDFNPSQASFARHLAAHTGAAPELAADSFAEFAARTDLPDFDLICLHGIWSWITDDNRRVLVDFIRRKLKIGGVLYLSYNAMPGWAPLLPLRQLLAGHAANLGGSRLKRTEQALDFAKRVVATAPLYLRNAPQLAERLQSLEEHSPHYLAHEYLNGTWQPMHFSAVADWLHEARLEYVCNANPLDQIEALNTTPEQQALMAEIDDPLQREDLRDLMISRSFRKDCWIKGRRPLPASAAEALLRTQRVVLAVPRERVQLTIRSAAREASLHEAIHLPLLDCLQDQQILTLGELETRLRAHNVSPPQLREAVMVLAGSGYLAPAHGDAAIEQLCPRVQAFNRHLLEYARSDAQIQYLASPVTGGGLAVDRISQLMLLARQEGLPREQWPAYAWHCLEAHGQRLLKDGVPVESEADNIAELDLLAGMMQAELLPVLQRLKAV